MLTITNRLALVVLVYLVSWTVSYWTIMGFDYRYYFEYLALAWSSPGEKPVFIHIMAIMLTIIVISIAFSIRRKKQ